jgi:hypothetical protein
VSASSVLDRQVLCLWFDAGPGLRDAPGYIPDASLDASGMDFGPYQRSLQNHNALEHSSFIYAEM